MPSPFDCFLVNRGLKTLHVRMKEHMKNGLAVAHFLEASPRVERVIHPGLFFWLYCMLVYENIYCTVNVLKI